MPDDSQQILNFDFDSVLTVVNTRYSSMDGPSGSLNLAVTRSSSPVGQSFGAANSHFGNHLGDNPVLFTFFT